VLAFGAAALVGLALAGLPGTLAGPVAAGAVAAWLRRRRAARESELLEEQLGDAVSSVAAALRAGLSLPQALRFAADEGEPPLAPRLREVVDRTSMGIPLDDALARFAELGEGPDVRLVAGVLRLHRRTGGDLPRVLDGLVSTLRERRGAAREVRSLTAQARLSGAILGFLPIGFFVFLLVTSREDVEAAYRSRMGMTAILVGLVLQSLAFVWIRRLLRVT
jgi:tight adherence protein B